MFVGSNSFGAPMTFHHNSSNWTGYLPPPLDRFVNSRSGNIPLESHDPENEFYGRRDTSVPYTQPIHPRAPTRLFSYFTRAGERLNLASRSYHHRTNGNARNESTYDTMGHCGPRRSTSELQRGPGRRLRIYRENSDDQSEYSAQDPPERHPEPRHLNYSKIRSAVLACCASGIFEVFLLCLYLVLALSDQSQKHEVHIPLLIVIVITTVFFCHTLVRICILLFQYPNRQHHVALDNRGITEYSSHATSIVPIPATPTRDDASTISESETISSPPPAYGTWRESVTVDPNHITWQRIGREFTDACPPSLITRPPPSYLSNNGVNNLASFSHSRTVFNTPSMATSRM